MSTLSFKNINKIYDNNVQAVFDFNLEIKDKEFIVFVGPSGCGKSTTLRMVAGLESITTGELYIDGILINNVEPKDRNIAMVFQNYALYPHMTVYDNMAFALKLRKVPQNVYLDTPEIIPLKKEAIEKYKTIRKLYRRAKKLNEPKDIFIEINRLYDELFILNDQINEILKPNQVIGIFSDKINELTKQINKLEKQISKYKEKLNKPNLDESILKLYQDAINQKSSQLEVIKKDLDYYQNNEVPILKPRKLTKLEIDIEIQKAARILDLGQYLLRKPAALSGGQRQRVALGRCIVRNPKVFLMDEPLSNLDAKLRVQTRSEISKIHKRVNATTIYVTHDQTEAMTMADRIVVMKDGHIQQIGEPEQIYSNPANIFVAGFIGNPAMNFLDVTFDGSDLVIAFSKEEEKEIHIKLNKEQKELLKQYVDKQLVVGIRPESLFREGDAKLDKTAQFIDITCDFRELLGYEAVVYSFLNGQKFLVKLGSEEKISSGDILKIGFNSNALYFFDKQTTQRIK